MPEVKNTLCWKHLTIKFKHLAYKIMFFYITGNLKKICLVMLNRLD